jgi:uncharacterized protein (DUF488 family)
VRQAWPYRQREARINNLIDVRTFPGSRRHPQFGREALEKSLAENGIWEGKALGGRRKGVAGSQHIALRNESFRAYADHMQTQEFIEALEQLVSRAETAAIMCAERLPWQCHRFLISDYLVANKKRVIHLVSKGKQQEHKAERHSPRARARARLRRRDPRGA